MKPERIELVENAVRVCTFLADGWVTVAQITAKIENVTTQHVRSVLARLREDGEVLQRKYANNTQYFWAGPRLEVSELLKVPPEDVKSAEVAFKTPARTYVNGSMPNGDASYWKSQTTWGRN